MKTLPYWFELAAALSPCAPWFDAGILGHDSFLCRVQLAKRIGKYNACWSPLHLARLALKANMETAEGRGRGMKSAKREAKLSTFLRENNAIFLDAHATAVRYRRMQRAADEASELRTEGRIFA